jgi:hypothetical protein
LQNIKNLPVFLYSLCTSFFEMSRNRSSMFPVFVLTLEDMQKYRMMNPMLHEIATSTNAMMVVSADRGGLSLLWSSCRKLDISSMS